jgi:tetratricopeptide (TPR) repeat protein
MIDPMANLDMEKKMGFGMKDVDDFLERAKDVEQKINDIKSGKISVEQLEREREQEEREKAEAAAAKAKRLADIERRRVEREAKEKVEEHARWWEGADVLYPIDNDEVLDDSVQNAAGETARDTALRKYENDYGHWSKWTPSDPASLEEQQELERKKTEKENAEFEKNNKDFCDNFIADQKKREKSNAKKDETAGGKRLKGNRYFKARKFDEALKLYRESLSVRPYEKATLLNVAQVYLKKRAWDDALEFCNRAVRIGRRGGADFHAKALSRRATAYSSRKHEGDLREAVNDLKKAMALLQESESKASQQSLSLIMEQFEQATQALRDEASESIVAEKLDKLPPPPPKKSKEEESAELLKQLRELSTKEDPLSDLLKGEGDGDSLRAVEEAIKESCCDDALPKLAGALRSSPDARVLCRVRGGVSMLLRRLGAEAPKDAGAIDQIATGGFDLDDAAAVDVDARTTSVELVDEPKAGLVLSALAAAVREEPKSKVVAIDGGALAIAVKYLADTAAGSAAEARAAACELCAELAGSDGAAPQAVQALLKNEALLSNLSRCCGAGAAAFSSKATAALRLPKAAGAAHAARCLRDLAAVNHGPLLSVEPCVVETLGALMRGASKLKPTPPGEDLLGAIGNPDVLCSAIAGEAVGYACFGLAHLAKDAKARKRFGVAVTGDAKATPIGVCVAVAADAKHPTDTRGAALVAAANACFECKEATAACEAAGGVAETFKLLKSNCDHEVKARAAGLLARLTTAPGSRGAATLRSAPGAPASLAQAAAAAAARTDEWAAIERDNVVRALAGVLQGKDTTPETINEFLKRKGYELVLAQLPEPKRDLGAITAQSVCQTPSDPPSANCAGNAAKIVLSALNSSDAEVRGAVADTLIKREGLERLVCALANYKEITVRKNCAVTLAKAMAARPAAKERVRELRGIEMITTLGDKLTS